jgi:hypothetical protein
MTKENHNDERKTIMDLKSHQLINDAIAKITEAQSREDAGWRWSLFTATIKMLRLAKQDIINEPGHNPRSVAHLRSIVTTKWLWEE